MVWKKAVCARHPDLMEDLEVSSEGQIRRISSGKVYKPQRHEGYSCLERLGKRIKVHQIVAQTFLGPPTNTDDVVDHKDGNKENNRASNLQYLSNAENSAKGSKKWEEFKAWKEGKTTTALDTSLETRLAAVEKQLAALCDALAKIGNFTPAS